MFKKLILFLFAVMSFSYVDANEANLHKAKLLFTSYFEEFKTLELSLISPSVGLSSPEIIFKSVVFPQPLSP